MSPTCCEGWARAQAERRRVQNLGFSNTRNSYQFASKHGRLLVTADDDFLALAAETPDHAGVAYWSKKSHFGQLVLALDELCFETTAEEARRRSLF